MSSPEEAAVVEAAVAALTPSARAAAAPGAASTEAGPRCDNCGASVPGRYCGNCGQRLEPPLHSLWHFLTVAFEDVTHADSRLWRTLWALLFKPGFLTREFLDGRRARYLPPVRLYLVLSVFFFVWLAAVGKPTDEAHMTPEVRAEVRAAIADARQAAQEARQATGAAPVLVIPSPKLAAPSGAAAASAPKGSFSGSALEGDTTHCKEIHYNGPWKSRVVPALNRACLQSAADQGRSLISSFMHNLPRAMFVFLPLLAAAMLLLYWHPRHYYVEHLLFCVHNHAFVFLAILIAGLLGTLLPFAATLIGWVTTFYLVWYVFRAMRITYGQGKLRTWSKFAVLAVVYLIAGSVMLAITTVYSLMTLESP